LGAGGNSGYYHDLNNGDKGALVLKWKNRVKRASFVENSPFISNRNEVRQYSRARKYVAATTTHPAHCLRKDCCVPRAATRNRPNVSALSREFNVSRKTIIRDLQDLIGRGQLSVFDSSWRLF
jgi:hypothetical protein